MKKTFAAVVFPFIACAALAACDASSAESKTAKNTAASAPVAASAPSGASANLTAKCGPDRRVGIGQCLQPLNIQMGAPNQLRKGAKP